MLRFLDGDLGCFTPVASDRFSRALVEIECLPVPDLYVARLDFFECFSHLKTPIGQKKSPTFLECQACYCDTAKTVRSVRLRNFFVVVVKSLPHELPTINTDFQSVPVLSVVSLPRIETECSLNEYWVALLKYSKIDSAVRFHASHSTNVTDSRCSLACGVAKKGCNRSRVCYAYIAFCFLRV